MAEIIKLLVDNPKIKRTTKAKSDASLKVLEKGVLLGVRYPDGSFTLKIGDGVTAVKDLYELKSGGGESGDVTKQDILINTLLSGTTIELDSQKFNKVAVDSDVEITLKDPITTIETVPEYIAELTLDETHLITFPENTTIRTNDPDITINNNKITVTTSSNKILHLIYQNKIATIINALIDETIKGSASFLQDLTLREIKEETSATLSSGDYTKIIPTIGGDLNITLNNETGKTKIFRGIIRLGDLGTFGIRKVYFPENTSIITNDADVGINNHIAEIKKSDTYYFTIYDNYCELINTTIASKIPEKTSELVNDIGLIKKDETLKNIENSVNLYVDSFNEINESGDINLNLTGKFKSGVSIPADKIPEYSARVILKKDKKIILPVSVTNIKVSDEESLEVGDGFIKAIKGQGAEVELSIQGENCFAYVWQVIYTKLKKGGTTTSSFNTAFKTLTGAAGSTPTYTKVHFCKESDVPTSAATVVNVSSIVVSGTVTGKTDGLGELWIYTADNDSFTSYGNDMSYMFSGCSGLTSLDLSSFNTSNVTNMNSMFRDCSNLEHIYASESWYPDKTAQVTNSTNMFAGCTKLPNFDSSLVKVEMAKLVTDGGYMSLKA